MNLFRFCLLSTALLILGCGSNDSKVVGEWKGRFEMKDGTTKPGANLSIAADHRFRELFKNLEVVGTWSLSGDTLTLKSTTINGHSVEETKQKMLSSKNEATRASAAGIDQPMTLTLHKDGNRLLGAQNDGIGGQAVYTKE